MFMPLNVRLRRVVLFGAERGEGREKLDKIARFADEIVAVPESLPCRFEDADDVPANVVVHAVAAVDADLGALVSGASLVVSDLESRALNERIAALCRDRGILVNVLDEKDLCDVYLTALVERPNLLLSVSTGGRCAFLAKEIRKELEDWARDRDAVAAVVVAARDAVDPGLGKAERIERLRRVYFDPEVRRFLRDGRVAEAEERCRRLVRGAAVAMVAGPRRLRGVHDLADEAAAAVLQVTASDVARERRAGNAPALVDVREPAEFETCRIDGAVNVPRGVLETWAVSNLSSADAPLVLISENGVRSRLAAASLLALGCGGVSSLLGGIEAWRKEGGRLVEGRDDAS